MNLLKYIVRYNYFEFHVFRLCYFLSHTFFLFLYIFLLMLPLLIIYVSGTQYYNLICVHYSLLTTKGLVFICHLHLITFIHFALPLPCSPPVTINLLSISMSFFLFCFVCLFVSFLFYISYINEIIQLLSFSI